MSVLSDETLENLQKSGELVIYPLLEITQIKGARVDIRLDNVFYLIKRIDVDSYDAMKLSHPGEKPINYLDKSTIPYGEAFVIHPGEFALAPSFEGFKIPGGLIGLLDGRSSLGRLGIIVHVTSGSVDPGFSGPLVLELANLGRIPVKLFPMMRVASVKFLRLEGKVKRTYQSKDKYLGIKNLLYPLSRLHEDADLGTIERLSDYV